MKRLMIYLTVVALTMAVASPGLAQTAPADQYNVPELTCDNYLEFEVPPPELVEECEAEVINCDNYYLYEVPPSDLVANCEPPQDLPCSDYYEYELLRPHLPERCEGGTGGGLDAIPAASNSSNQTFENFTNALSGLKSEEANESEAVAAELDEPAEKPDKGTPKAEAKKDLVEITELPETGGAAVVLLGSGALLLAGGLMATRLLR